MKTTLFFFIAFALLVISTQANAVDQCDKDVVVKDSKNNPVIDTRFGGFQVTSISGGISGRRCDMGVTFIEPNSKKQHDGGATYYTKNGDKTYPWTLSNVAFIFLSGDCKQANFHIDCSQGKISDTATAVQTPQATKTPSITPTALTKKPSKVIPSKPKTTKRPATRKTVKVRINSPKRG